MSDLNHLSDGDEALGIGRARGIAIFEGTGLRLSIPRASQGDDRMGVLG
jgi:hypothetical protein